MDIGKFADIIMKVRILSDLHLDINNKTPFQLADKDTFTIICGDISGSISKTCKWIDNNIHNGLFIAGNHMFYDEHNLTIEQIFGKYSTKYPLNKPVSFLNNNHKVINDIVFIGSTLWTDYKLFGAGSAELYKYYATRCMNDFKYGRIENEGNIARLTPEYCENAFQQSIEYIDDVCKIYTDKTIVVITHHAPSSQSIDKDYLLHSETAAAFASNLENFILDHPNIKLWCHGHIHLFKDYQIGDCRIICNPRGYEQMSETTGFNPDFIIELNNQ